MALSTESSKIIDVTCFVPVKGKRAMEPTWVTISVTAAREMGAGTIYRSRPHQGSRLLNTCVVHHTYHLIESS